MSNEDQDTPEQKRCFVPLPHGYFAMSDDEATEIDETIADEIARQLGLTPDEEEKDT